MHIFTNMNVYFITTLKTAIEHKSTIEDLLKHLEESGHKVSLRSKLIYSEEYKGAVGIEEVSSTEEMDYDKLSKVFKDNQKKILTCDVVIAEMSNQSTGIGYEIAQSTMSNKPVLLIGKKTKKFSENFTVNSSNRLSYKQYADVKEANQIVDDFLRDAKKKLDSKFILIIPPEIEQYLSWASNKKGIRKAEIVRTAIEKQIEIDNDYKKYLSDYN